MMTDDQVRALTDEQVLAACREVEAREGPWWGPEDIAAALGVYDDADLVPALQRLRLAGLVDFDACGTGPDGHRVLAWWVVA